MEILLTNDDGYDAEGIRILYEKLKAYGDVTLVAPNDHKSGASVSRIFWNQAHVFEHEEEIISVEGTPADAVAFALHGLNKDFDLIVSGVNNGHNLGADTVYSGTVGAAMEALKHKKKAVAFSTDFNHFDIVRDHFESIFDYILEHDLLSEQYMLNVNFPTRDYSDVKGIRVTELGFRPVKHYYEKSGDHHYTSKRRFLPFEFVDGTDIHAVRNGYVSMTPLQFTNRTKKGIDDLKGKVPHDET